jgi:acyl carrier protein
MDDTKKKVRSFFSSFFRTESLGDDEDIFGLELVNSLFALQLVAWVESEFGITVEDEDLEIENFNSINAVARLVAHKSAASVTG